MADTYQIYELPFTSRPQYVNVRLVGVQYRLKLAWNIQTQCWIIDIYDFTDRPLVCGMPLVTGIDLLAQYAYLGIGGQLLVVTDQTAVGGVVPGFDDLGTTGHVYFMPDGAQPLPPTRPDIPTGTRVPTPYLRYREPPHVR